MLRLQLCVVALAVPLCAQTRFECLGKRHLPDETDHAAAVADFDADGDPDLLVQSGRLLLNDGTARFGVGATLPPLADPPVATAGDFDGDGDLDVVSALAALVFVEQSPGLTFADTTGTRFPALPTGFRIVLLVAGDIDGDVDLDLVVEASRSVPSVLVNDGTGRFAFAFTPSSGSSQINVTLGTRLADFDGDGVLDLIRISDNPNTNPHDGVWRNTGNGAFALHQSLGQALEHALPIEFDGDGDLDLVVMETAPLRRVVLWRNDGPTGFTEDRGAFPVTTEPLGSVMAVLGDRTRPVVFVAPHFVFSRSAWLSGAIVVHTVGELASTERRPFVADFDRDGRDDLLRDAHVLHLDRSSNQQHHFAELSSRNSIAGPAIAAADVDGDGDMELYVPDARSPELAVLRDDGAWERRPLPTVSPVAAPLGGTPRFADLDGDGDQDLVERGRLLINDGRGNFTLGSALRLPAGVIWSDAFDAGDLDGDGRADIAIATTTGLRILWNAGNGFFTAAPVLIAPVSSRVHIVDIDADGDQDLVGPGIWINRVPRFLLDESPLRLPIEYLSLGATGTLRRVGDLNGDGHPDIIDAFGWELHNDGNGFFAFTNPPRHFPMNARAFVDYDRDGDGDVVGTVGPIGAIGAGTYEPTGLNIAPVLEGVLTTAQDYGVGDIDDDGDPDLLTGSFVLVNHDTQLIAPFALRAGHEYELAVDFGPRNAASTRAVGLLLGLASGHARLLDWGTLRIDPAALIPWASLHVLAPGVEATRDAFLVPAGFPLGAQVLAQAIVVQDGRVRLTNVVADRVE